MRRSLFEAGSLLVPPVGAGGAGNSPLVVTDATVLDPGTSGLVVADATAAPFPIDLPDARGVVREIDIHAVTLGPNLVTVRAVNGQTIVRPGDQALSQVELGNASGRVSYAGVSLRPDGPNQNWRVVASIGTGLARLSYGPLAFLGAPGPDGMVYVGEENGASYQSRLVGGVAGWEAIALAPTTPVLLAPPAISGSTTQGETLTASPGEWQGAPPPAFTYQWMRDEAPIGGATGNTYVSQAADLGHQITVVVTATNETPASLSNPQITTSVAAESAPVTIVTSGQALLAQPIAFRTSGGGASSGVYTFAGAVAPPGSAGASPYLLFPAAPPAQVSQVAKFRLIIRNAAKDTLVQATLLNADGSLYNGDGGVPLVIEPGYQGLAGTSDGTVNVLIAGRPTANMKLALQNLVATEPGGFKVSCLGWMV